MKASCTPCEKSATVSFSGNRVAVMRLRKSTSSASGTFTRKGRSAFLSGVCSRCGASGATAVRVLRPRRAARPGVISIWSIVFMLLFGLFEFFVLADFVRGFPANSYFGLLMILPTQAIARIALGMAKRNPKTFAALEKPSQGEGDLSFDSHGGGAATEGKKPKRQPLPLLLSEAEEQPAPA